MQPRTRLTGALALALCVVPTSGCARKSSEATPPSAGSQTAPANEPATPATDGTTPPADDVTPHEPGP